MSVKSMWACLRRSAACYQMATGLAVLETRAGSSDSLASTSDDVPVSVDLVDERLYLGNLTAACHPPTLRRLGVTHVLTVDSVPLPRSVLDTTTLQHKYVKMADVPKEDLISHLPETSDFIQQSLDAGGTVLVHCYFGVSRSAAVVIAYLMRVRSVGYEEALASVRRQRRPVAPNVGFVAQLKLFGHMGCGLDATDPRYRQFRLKMAGQKLKEVKILPQQFAELVKPDPGLARERPEPLVYRCRRCRRVVASQHNLIPHLPRELRLERARRAAHPPPCADLAARTTSGAGADALRDKLRDLSVAADASRRSLLDDERNEYEGVMVDASVAARSDAAESCRLVYFVEPMAWMSGVQQRTQGKLHCPQCAHKLGSFSWVMGCKCPCGQSVAPAFYLVPSKVEWSNMVQNVQLTV